MGEYLQYLFMVHHVKGCIVEVDCCANAGGGGHGAGSAPLSLPLLTAWVSPSIPLRGFMSPRFPDEPASQILICSRLCTKVHSACNSGICTLDIVLRTS